MRIPKFQIKTKPL